MAQAAVTVARKYLLAVISVVVTVLALSAPALSSTGSDKILVGFTSDTTMSEERAAVADADGTVVDRFQQLDIAVVEPDQGESRSDVVSSLEQMDGVRYAEPAYKIKASVIPNDTYFSRLWGLYNVGQLSSATPGADIDAPGAWNEITSSSVVVAVLDTGIDYTHPDLEANVWQNSQEVAGNGIDDDHNGYTDDVQGFDFFNYDNDPYDDNSHGTHVSGTIGAVGNNGLGVTGVVWNVELMPVKFLGYDGSGDTTAAVEAINYATENGAQVINASWGSAENSQAVYDALKAFGETGGVVITAAGNNGSNIDMYPEYPAAYSLDNIVSVAASDASDYLASFSNYGSVSVDLAAPGKSIYSTVPGASYYSHSGTSMAAPSVSGAAALYLEKYPSATPNNVRQALISSAEKVPSLSGLTASSGRLYLPGFLNTSTSDDPPDDTTVKKNPKLKISKVKKGKKKIVLRGKIEKQITDGTLTATAKRRGSSRKFKGKVKLNRTNGTWKATFRVKKKGKYTVKVVFNGATSYLKVTAKKRIRL